MKIIDLFNLGNKYNGEGNSQMAAAVYGDVIKEDPNISVFLAAHLNLADIFRKTGNVMGERNELLAFLSLTQVMRLVPNAEARLQEIEQKLHPQPPQEKK